VSGRERQPLVLGILLCTALVLASASAAPGREGTGTDARAQELALGSEHAREHSRIRGGRLRAAARWQRLSPAERANARRRAARQAGTAARATAGNPAEVGSWDSPFEIANETGYAIHSALLRTGKVLFWGYPPEDLANGGKRPAGAYAWLWDPALGQGPGAFRAVPPPTMTVLGKTQAAPIYCSGMSFLPDGQLLAVGGNQIWSTASDTDPYEDYTGLNAAVVFDPIAEAWRELPRPAGAHGRWYPSQVELGDGRTAVVAGYTEDAPGTQPNLDLEVFSPPAAGRPNGEFALLTSPAQRRLTELYPHLFTLPNGRVLMAGPGAGDSAVLDVDAPAPWRDLPPAGSTRIGSTAVLRPQGPGGSSTVTQFGGLTATTRPNRSTLSTAETIDAGEAIPAWRPDAPLNLPRSYHNTVLLPDGSMVTVGGQTDTIDADPDPQQKRVELFDPASASWRLGPAQAEVRGYHSVGLLLPDGRVLSAGDDARPYSQTGFARSDTAEIYSPPYLFKGPRPVLSSAPGALPFAAEFEASTPDPGQIDRAVLVSPSAVTHAADMTQRLVPLGLTGRGSGYVRLSSPPAAAVAPPGWYMLFLMNGDGVPSVARWVRLGSDAPAPPITPPPDPAPPPDPDPPPTSPPTAPTAPPASVPSTVPGISPPATSPALDRDPPAIGLRVTRRGPAARVEVTMSEAGRFDLRLSRGRRTLAKRSGALSAGGKRLIGLRVPSRPSSPLILTLTGTDAAGNRAERTMRWPGSARAVRR